MRAKQHLVIKPRAIDIEYLLSQLAPELREVAMLHFIDNLPSKGLATRLG